MLHDQRKDPVSLHNFADWLRTKNPDEIYQWSYCLDCACGQYAKWRGIRDWGMNDTGTPEGRVLETANNKAKSTSTFGDLLRVVVASPEYAAETAA